MRNTPTSAELPADDPIAHSYKPLRLEKVPGERIRVWGYHPDLSSRSSPIYPLGLSLTHHPGRTDRAYGSAQNGITGNS